MVLFSLILLIRVISGIRGQVFSPKQTITQKTEPRITRMGTDNKILNSTLVYGEYDLNLNQRIDIVL